MTAIKPDDPTGNAVVAAYQAEVQKRTGKAQPWHPITNPRHLRHLGKLGEEASELSEAAARLAKMLSRSVIQGLEGKDPDTGEANYVAVAKEIADVMALSIRAVNYFKLDLEAIQARIKEQTDFHNPWFDL